MWHFGESRGAYEVLAWEFKGKRQLRKPSVNGEDNVRMDLQEIICGSVDLIDEVQNRGSWLAAVRAVMNILLSKNAGYYWLAKVILVSKEDRFLDLVSYLWDSL
jgi:hypothetical protein